MEFGSLRGGLFASLGESGPRFLADVTDGSPSVPLGFLNLPRGIGDGREVVCPKDAPDNRACDKPGEHPGGDGPDDEDGEEKLGPLKQLDHGFHLHLPRNRRKETQLETP